MSGSPADDVNVAAVKEAGERFHHWLDLYQDRLYRRCLRWSFGEETRARDAFQETWTQAWLLLRDGSFRGDDGPEAWTWLSRSAFYTCVRLTRAEQRQRLGEYTAALTPLLEVWLRPEAPPDPATVGRLLGCVEALGPAEQWVVRHRWGIHSHRVDETSVPSWQEVARAASATLGDALTPDAARMRGKRALAQLRRCLGEVR